MSMVLEGMETESSRILLYPNYNEPVTTFSLVMDMAAYSRQEETTSLLHGALRTILPILYYKLALGILALGLVFTGMMIAITSAAFLGLVGFTSYYYSFRLGAKCWEAMEI